MNRLDAYALMPMKIREWTPHCEPDCEPDCEPHHDPHHEPVVKPQSAPIINLTVRP